MEDIELVIKIPEEIQLALINNIQLSIDQQSISDSVIKQAIINGIPLPKRYGRLIDADALKKDDEVTQWLSLNAVRTGKTLKSFSELFIKKIDAADTILEADKECEAKVEREVEE